MKNKVVAGKNELNINDLNKAGILTWSNYLKQNDVKGKVVGIMIELNVVWGEKNGDLIISNDSRIQKAWHDLKATILAGARVYIIYHVQDKKNFLSIEYKDNNLIYNALMDLITKEIGSSFIFDRVTENMFMGDEAKTKIKELSNGKIDGLLLQNVRINEAEREMEIGNDVKIVEPFVQYTDIYVGNSWI